MLGLLFNMTNWPVYAWANIYHFGTPFATPCSHSEVTRISDEEEEGAVRYVVESFGKRLQNVPLQSPNATQMIIEQYTEWLDERPLQCYWASGFKSLA